jgi:hypothetical protein
MSYSLTQSAMGSKSCKPKIYRSLYFNSEDRSYGTNDAPAFQLDPPLTSTHKLKLLAANIPISFYAFENFTFNLVEATGSLPVSIVLNGNYTNSQMLTALATQLTTASAATGNTLTYTATYNSILARFTISATGNFTVNSSGSANKNLGFRAPSATPASSQTSDSVIRMTKQYLVVESDELIQTLATNARSIYNTNSSRPIVGVIPITNGPYEYQYYEAPESAEYLQSNDAFLERISFRVNDLAGNPISFNGLPWSIKLGIFTDGLG